MTSPLLQDGRALLDAERLIRAGLADRRASFELSFGRLPAHTGFLVVAGVENLLELLTGPLVDAADLDGAMQAGAFTEALAQRLARLALRVDVDAMPDGTIAFPRTPVVTIEGPFLDAVLLGTLCRASIQKATAIATRAARLCLAAGDDTIIDGSSAHAASSEAGLAMARAAHVGGAAATTNVAAAARLGIPFRGTTRIDLGALAAPAGGGGDGWGELASDAVHELGLGDDEEAMLLEAKRVGARASGWIARGLGDAGARALPMRYELVALEQDGAWAPRRGASDAADVVPGRKLAVRYSDAARRAVADVVHLQTERMAQPKQLGAATLAPLARAIIRGGRALEAPESPAAGRERAIAGRRALPSAVAHLRCPASYPVRLSAGLAAKG